MSKIIEAKNLGIKFKLTRFKRKSLKIIIDALFGIKKETNLEKDFWALKGISFSIEKGDILGVIGTNGSGKSTLLRLIGGIYDPDEGSLEVNGTVSTLLSLGAGFKDELSGRENIFISGVIMGFSESEVKACVPDIIKFAELEKFINEPVMNYSSGMRARLGFSIAIHLKRDVMLVDEILGVGDFRFREKSEAKMKEIIQSGQTVIIVSHNLENIRKYANKAIWINKGALIKAGGIEEVIDSYVNS